MLILFSTIRISRAQPTVQTLQATDITTTSATLNGNLNTNGQDSDWSFKVFDHSGNEIQTVCPDAWNAGSAGQSPVSCPVTGLQPSTTYGFALIAIWHGGSGGYQYGTIVSFTTLASGPGAETDAATSVTDTSAVLNGVVTTNGQDTFWMFTVRDANGAFVQNCPSGNLQFVTANVGTQSVTCQVSQLQPSTTYSFVLQACWQPSGTCTYGSSLSFTTLGGYMINTIFTNILTASHPVTDWAISNLRITPSSPKVGDLLTFALDLTALSTKAPYPQSVDTSCWVDNAPPFPPVGASPNGGATTYYGPTGIPMTLTVNYPWTATAGTHTTTCWVDPTNDPDASNNKISLTFTIGSAVGAPAVQTVQVTDITDTSATLHGNLNPNGQNTQWWFEVDWSGPAIYCPNQPGGQMSGSTGQTSVNCIVNNLQPFTTYTFQLYARWPGSATGWQGGGWLSFATRPSTASATSTVSTPAQTTNSQTSSNLQMTSQATSQTATSGSSLSDIVQENSMIITAALLVLAVVLGVVAMRSRGRRWSHSRSMCHVRSAVSAEQRTLPRTSSVGAAGSDSKAANRKT